MVPAAVLSTGSPAVASDNPNDDTTSVVCDGLYIDKIDVDWRFGSDSFTKISVTPTHWALLQLFGGASTIEREFFACMRMTADTGATIYAKWIRVLPAGPQGLCFWCDDELRFVSTVVFSPDSDDRAKWQTFIDQLRCHDFPPFGFEELVTSTSGKSVWDLEGHHPPSNDMLIWFLSACNWD